MVQAAPVALALTEAPEVQVVQVLAVMAKPVALVSPPQAAPVVLVAPVVPALMLRR